MMVKIGLKRTFKNRSEFRNWLEQNFDRKQELWLVVYKKHTGKNYIQLDEAVEEALCFGWIDGIMKRIDDRKHVIRFSPRRKGSVWSEINIDRVNKLIKEGKMTEAGLVKFKELDKERISPNRGTEQEIPDFVIKGLKKNKKAWKKFNEMAPSHQRQYAWWIADAKKEETRERRLKKAVDMIENESK
jgi:uncharacterized protein YdeI (YjbR/CyaY-like superfamily)